MLSAKKTSIHARCMGCLGLLMLTLWLASCAGLPSKPGLPEPLTSAPAQPEMASGATAQTAWSGTRFAVASANPLATDAGYAMIQAGGSAMDAAIAVQMVLGLVEPQSSGLGGGAFLLHHNGQEVQAFDGRETAPAEVDEKLLLGKDGKPLAFYAAVVGGRAVGVPGLLRMLELAHQRHGKLPWAQLFAPAMALAQNGFPISPRLHSLLNQEAHLKKDPVAAAYFYRSDGAPHPVGHMLRNPELAQLLRKISLLGSKAFYEGETALAMVNKVRSHPSNPGLLSLADLAAYQPKVRLPLCFVHAGAAGRSYRLCGFPPPSSGTIAIGQILGMLSRQGAQAALADGQPQADWLHLYLEAARLAFADRAQYVADPDFVAAPGGNWLSMLAPAYLAQRAQQIGATSTPSPKPGWPGGLSKNSYGTAPSQVESGTSHISIVDPQGNAVAMTSTIEDQFGSRQMVQGFLLNNQLTDFSATPVDAQGKPLANRVQPGKRSRSSMSPTLVFDANDKRLVMTAGSPGGAAIIHYTAKTLLGVLNWGLTPQQAIDLPNFGLQGAASVLEEGRFAVPTLEALRARGAELREQPMTSGIQAIHIAPTGGLSAGADPRREGLVMGE
jgi:gamma-glutamyltranspeptidase / glutathione hydrolase